MFFKKSVFNEKMPYLLKRQQIIKAVRKFFDARNYWEVETPILQISPCMDTHIHAFKTGYKDISLEEKQGFYLHTSPEFGMKKLLSAGCERIYQICHVFRNTDNTKQHSPEFTMIEWYQAGLSYEGLMDEACALIDACALAVEDCKLDKAKGWKRISVRECFTQYAAIDLDMYLHDLGGFKAAVRAKGLHVADDDEWDDVFHRVMLEYVEPHLGHDQPTVLYDYPACMAALARLKPQNPDYAERFEIYINGIELANGFGELTDAEEQRRRFVHEMDEKERLYGERYPVDDGFIAALEQGLPPCSGIALGVDRLVMILTGAQHINDVLWHPVEIF